MIIIFKIFTKVYKILGVIGVISKISQSIGEESLKLMQLQSQQKIILEFFIVNE